MEPSNFDLGYDAGERASAGGMETHPSSSDFSAASCSPLIPGGGCPDAGFLQETVENFTSDIGFDFFLPEFTQPPGAENAVTATNEHCSNNPAGSGVSGIHRHDTRSSGTEAGNSSQQLGSHSFKRRKDEHGRFGKQEHSSINHQLSQGMSYSTLPGATGEEDEIQSSDANVGGEEPRVGMAFRSEKDVYDFYSNYAKNAGFIVRRGKAEYLGSDKSIIKAKSFLCSCQGHKSKEQIDKPTRYKRQETRTGCEAMIKCNVNDGMWHILKVVLEHNHDLKGCLADVQKRAEGSHTKTSLSTGQSVDEITTAREQAFVSTMNLSGVSQGTRESRPMPGFDDIQGLIDYFNNLWIEDPLFFHTLQLQAAQGMMNFFWRDSRSKVDYMHFGDVLVLDTRCGINKYDMICAAFWGLNHHRQRIIFGWGMLVDQTVGSFSWLLRSFLKAMGWKKPLTIITDMSEEIGNALSDVMPETRHCLPTWSIMSSVSNYLSTLIDQVDGPGLVDLFSECVFHVHSEEEFESKWSSFIGKTKLHEDPWLASLYRMREKWSHAFRKYVFSAGLLMIENNENARDVLGNLFCKTMTLYQIALRCGEVAKHMRTKELTEDRRCDKDMEKLKSKSPMEKEAEHLYTRLMFKMFQGELINSLSLAIEESEVTATYCKFKLTEEGTTKVETVKFDPSNLTLPCSCGKFESIGILCFHALKVLNFKNIFKIPPHYLMKRWTKSAKDNLPVVALSTEIARDRNLFNSFYPDFMERASQVAHICQSKRRRKLASMYIHVAMEQIANAPRTEEMTDVIEDSVSNDDMGQTI